MKLQLEMFKRISNNVMHKIYQRFYMASQPAACGIISLVCVMLAKST